jgi:hypothetical protein
MKSDRVSPDDLGVEVIGLQLVRGTKPPLFWQT